MNYKCRVITIEGTVYTIEGETKALSFWDLFNSKDGMVIFRNAKYRYALTRAKGEIGFIKVNIKSVELLEKE